MHSIKYHIIKQYAIPDIVKYLNHQNLTSQYLFPVSSFNIFWEFT